MKRFSCSNELSMKIIHFRHLNSNEHNKWKDETESLYFSAFYLGNLYKILGFAKHRTHCISQSENEKKIEDKSIFDQKC